MKRKLKRIAIVLLVAIAVSAPFASAKYADTGDVVWSTRLDGLTLEDLETMIGTDCATAGYVTLSDVTTYLINNNYVTSEALDDYVLATTLRDSCVMTLKQANSSDAPANVWNALNGLRFYTGANRFYRCGLSIQLWNAGSHWTVNLNSICFYDANTIYALGTMTNNSNLRYILKSTGTGSTYTLTFRDTDNTLSPITGNYRFTIGGWVDKYVYTTWNAVTMNGYTF